MASLFDNGNTEWIKDDATGILGYPLSMSAQIYPDESTDNTIIAIVDTAGADDWLAVLFMNDTENIQSYSKRGTSQRSQTSTATSINTWSVATGVWASTASRISYLNGGGKNEEATTLVPVGIDRLAVGALADSTVALYFSGRIAEIGVWNVALSDADAAILGKFYSPLFVKPQNLVHYWRLINGNLVDVIGGVTLVTGGNAPDVAPHSPVIVPAGQQLWHPTSGAPPSGRIMGAIAGQGGLVGHGGIAGRHGGLAA